MKETTIPSSMALLKKMNGTKLLAGKKTDGKSALFSEKLKHAFSKQVTGKQADNLKGALTQLLQILKQSLQGADIPLDLPTTQMKQIDALLKKASKCLQELVKEKDPQGGSPDKNLQLLIAVIGQFQQLLQTRANGMNPVKLPETQQKKIRYVMKQLAASIERLIDKPKSFIDLSTGKKAGGPGNAALQSKITFVHKGTELKGTQQQEAQAQRKLQHVIHNIQGQNQSQVANASKGHLAQDVKALAATTFRRTVHPNDDKSKGLQFAGGFAPGGMSRLQQFVIHVRQNGTSANVQQFIRDFEQILAKSSFTGMNGKQQLTLKLYPQNLGMLNIQLTRQNGQLSATLFASSAAAKNLVEANLHQLQGAFLNQNINVQKLQVIGPFAQQQPEHTPDHGQPEGDTPHHREPEQGQDQRENDQQKDSDFMEWLDQLQHS